jgi:hypothetical protein
MMMGGPDRLFGEGCSSEAGEGSGAKRPKGEGAAKVGHFHDDVRPTQFAKVVLSPALEMLPILTGFWQYLGIVPRTIILKTNIGCSCMVKLRDVKGTIYVDQGWLGFAIAHQVKIGYFMTFKMLRSDVFIKGHHL